MVIGKQQLLDVATIALTTASEVISNKNSSAGAPAEEEPSLFTDKSTTETAKTQVAEEDKKDATTPKKADAKPADKHSQKPKSFWSAVSNTIWTIIKKAVPAIVDKFSDKKNLERNRSLVNSAIQLGDFAINKAQTTKKTKKAETPAAPVAAAPAGTPVQPTKPEEQDAA